MRYGLILFAVLCYSTVCSAANITRTASAVIGVSGHDIQSPSVRFILAHLYELGATPILLNIHHPETISDIVPQLDGVVLAGNSFDINPADYNETPAPQTRNELNDNTAAARAEYEKKLLAFTLKYNIPTFGICGGMQRMNIADHAKDGGTLFQHLEGENQYHLTRTFDPHRPVDFIRIAPDTTLASLLQNTPAMIQENSLHHQAVKHVRKGFRISATNVVGTIEAIEADPKGIYGNHPFLLGVQWHPEYAASDASRKLMNAFVTKAREYRSQRTSGVEIPHDYIDNELETILRKGVVFIRDHYGYAMPDISAQ